MRQQRESDSAFSTGTWQAMWHEPSGVWIEAIPVWSGGKASDQESSIPKAEIYFKTR